MVRKSKPMAFRVGGCESGGVLNPGDIITISGVYQINTKSRILAKAFDRFPKLISIWWFWYRLTRRFRL